MKYYSFYTELTGSPRKLLVFLKYKLMVNKRDARTLTTIATIKYLFLSIFFSFLNTTSGQEGGIRNSVSSCPV